MSILVQAGSDGNVQDATIDRTTKRLRSNKMGIYKLTYKQSEYVRANSDSEARGKCWEMFEDGPCSIYASATELHKGDPEYEAAVRELGEED